MINQLDLQSSNSIFDAVIIGAGWAGLGAAQSLKQNGIDNVLVVEARDYVGGRSITSHHFGPVNPVDLGASWIHGAQRNPIQELVKRYDVPFGRAEGEWKNTAVWYDGGGDLIAPSKMKEIKKLRKGFMKYMRRRQKNNDPDTSLESVVDDYCRAKGIEPGSDEDHALRWILDAEIVQEYAAELKDLSLKYWDIDDELSGDDSYLAVGDGGGYSSVVQRYAAGIKANIRLQTTATKVDYCDANCITLTCQDAFTGEKCEPIRAKCAIVTLPLGVLKAESVAFAPELPKSKREAICALGSGLMNKVALCWEGMEEEKIFWPMDKEWILHLAPNVDADLITEFYNPCSFDPKQRVLIGFVIGEAARTMEAMDDAEIADRAVRSLRSIFGEDMVPPPSKVLVTRWEADEYARGSYSFQKVNSLEHSRRDLARPVADGRLHFAGEATDEKFPATTHGALLSGKRAGRAVVSQLKSKSSQ